MDLCLDTGKVAGRRLILRPRTEELVQGLPLRPPLPSQARAAQAFGPGHRGEATPVLAPENACAAGQRPSPGTAVVTERTVIERSFMLYTTPSPRPRPLLRKWCHRRGPWPNPAALRFLAPHIQLVTVPFLLASELCSDACAGPGSSPFSRWLPCPLPGPSSWFFNCHFPAQHCPALLAVSPALVQALGTCPQHPLSLFSHLCVPSPEVTSQPPTLPSRIAGSLILRFLSS